MNTERENKDRVGVEEITSEQSARTSVVMGELSKTRRDREAYEIGFWE